MNPERPVLYGYWRSTAAFRVRIALNLKGLEFEARAVDLRGPGAQHEPGFRALNPAGLVPVLCIDGQVLSQSLAICEYLDETRPTPPLLPEAAARRALARAMAMDIACDVHPLNNLRVQQYLRQHCGQDEAGIHAWMTHWMALAFATFEQRLAGAERSGPCCLDAEPGIADIFLVAQAYNAQRFGFGLEPYPLVNAVVEHCRRLPAFVRAAPEAQAEATHT